MSSMMGGGGGDFGGIDFSKLGGMGGAGGDFGGEMDDEDEDDDEMPALEGKEQGGEKGKGTSEIEEVN